MEGINQSYLKNQLESIFKIKPQISYHLSGLISKIKVHKENSTQLSILAPQFHLLILVEIIHKELNLTSTNLTSFQFEYTIQSEYLVLEIDVLVNNENCTYAECYTYTDDNKLINKATIVCNKNL